MSERSGELRDQCANYALPSLPTYPSLPEEQNYSPSTPSERSSTREPHTEVDGWPTLTTARAMLRQLDADRERSAYWRSRWAEDHTDQAIETWLRSLLDWLESAPQPLNSEPALGPVEGRGVAEIRADLAHCDRGGVPWPAAARRLLADVPSLLAEVEAAHRFERSAAVESAGLVNTLNGVAAERDSLRGVVRQIREVRGCLGAGPMDYEAFVDEVDRALAAAADAPQPADPPTTETQR